jgi:conjugal transfer mating pair stabilization protein TraN
MTGLHPRVMHFGRRLAVLAAIALVPAVVIGQTPTTAARDDGKAFGGVQKPLGAQKTQNAPNATDLPNFTANPSQSSYYSSPSTLEPAGQSQASSSPGYQAVTQSLATRATFPASEINTTVTLGKAVAADPQTYTSGFSAGGTNGQCVPLPNTAISPGTYEQTCNSGYMQAPGGGPSTCPITLDHSFGTANTYECSELNAGFNGTDDCATFDPYGGICQITGTRPGTCLQWGGPGWCAEPGDPVRQMSCSAIIPGGTLLGTVQTYLGSTINDSACAAQKADPNCTPDPDVCTDSTPITRIVNGVAVTQPCWAWDRTYECGGNLVPMSDCSDLDNLGCTFLREQCITEETPCLTVDRVYACPLPPVPQENQQICDGDVYCLNGECDTIVREANTEFKDAAVALNVMSQAGKEFDENTLELFKGDRLTCSKTIFGLTNCCVPRGFPLLGGCNAEDQALKNRREDGQCTYVGTFCDQKVLGICLRKKEAHCCFISKISRILQEQGRPQIGKAWGDPKTEQCAGFTITEFQQLNLALMDFSEVYAEFTAAAQVPADLDVINDMQAKIAAYYAANPP